MRYLVVLLAACGAAQQRPAARDGAIGGITRDRTTDSALGFVTVHVRAHGDGRVLATRATREGLFGFDHLRPGRYDLDAEASGGARVEIANIGVVGGEAAVVDVELAPGTIRRDYTGDTLDSTIEHFAPPGHDPRTSVIEGAVIDASSRRRVAGAVVTAILGELTLQAVSDDQGRYRFDPISPGIYTISADYAVSGRGQIEVRRSDIAVAAGQGVRVPLWVDTEQ